MTDPIADMIIRIKNAQMVDKPIVDVPFSNLKFRIAILLSQQGYVGEVEKKYSKTRRIIRIQLKPEAIKDFKRVSKPGRRIYSSVKNIKLSAKGNGMIIVSTPKGIMRAQDARKAKLGGEIMAELW